MEAAGGDKKKMEFNLQKDCYLENVKEFVYDLDIITRNSRGDIIEVPPKTAE
jgi:hypothetical protein